MAKRVWFITGAGKGIGRAIALAALEAGDCVVATSRNPATMVFPNADEDRLMTLRLDVAEQDPEALSEVVNAAVERFGRIDVLVNNAGHGRITNFEETSEANVRELFEVNFFGLLRGTRAVLPVLRAQRSGCIVNIASAAGYAPGPALYHSSKFAVTGFRPRWPSRSRPLASP